MFSDPYSKIIDSDITLSHRTMNRLNKLWSPNGRNWHTLQLPLITILRSGDEMEEVTDNLVLMFKSGDVYKTVLPLFFL